MNEEKNTNVIRISDFDKKGYNGQYKRVFNALNKDEFEDYANDLTEGIYDITEEEQGGEVRDSEGGYYIYLSEVIPTIAYERLKKIKGVKII